MTGNCILINSKTGHIQSVPPNIHQSDWSMTYKTHDCDYRVAWLNWENSQLAKKYILHSGDFRKHCQVLKCLLLRIIGHGNPLSPPKRTKKKCRNHAKYNWWDWKRSQKWSLVGIFKQFWAMRISLIKCHLCMNDESVTASYAFLHVTHLLLAFHPSSTS